MQMTRHDWNLVGVVGICLLLISLMLWSLLGQSAVLPMLVLGITVQLAILVELYRRIMNSRQKLIKEMKSDSASYNKRIENWLSVVTFVEPNLPLPGTNRWTAAPDLLKLLIETIVTRKPVKIVEAGSGLSTLIMAYCLKKNGRGRIIALEHDLDCFDKSKNMISAHGLESIATIIHAPLAEHTINNDKWQWYDIESVELERGVDFLFIDGPPRQVQRLARYPALPLLYKTLRTGFAMILDDASRSDEQDIVARWKREYPDMELNYLDLEKGAVLISRSTRRS